MNQQTLWQLKVCVMNILNNIIDQTESKWIPYVPHLMSLK